MKNLMCFFLLILASITAQAQTPKGFSFQGVALDSSGYVVSNKPISLRFTISSDSIALKVKYQESNSITTDKFGQFTLTIGSGNNLNGNFDSIPWSTGNVYLKTEIDIFNSGNYKSVGTTKLLSVPYALYSAGSANSVPYTGATGPVNLGANDLTVNGLTVGRGNGANNSNTAIGIASLQNTSGFNNTAVGVNTLKNATSGYYNSAVGANALTSNTTGTDNDAVGNNTLRDNTVGSANVAIGGNALLKNITGIRNVTVGHAAYEQNLKGNNNLIMGSYAAQNLVDGNSNTILGDNAAQSWKSGNNNIVIGSNVGNTPAVSNLNNKLLIDVKATNTPLIYGSFDSSYLTINGNLNVTGKFSYDFTDTLNNTGIGKNVFFNKTTANSNVALGANALLAKRSGANNIGIGYQSMLLDSSSSNNISIGTLALSKNKTDGSTAIGHMALSNNTSGTYNTAIGYTTLLNNTTGNFNTAVGWSSLQANQTGSENTAIGLHSMGLNTTGSYNTAIGRLSAYSNKTGNRNSALGYGTLFYNANGESNTAVGIVALQNDTSSFNTAVGDWSLGFTKSGSGNTAIGYYSGSALDSGNNNIFIGMNAGNSPLLKKISNKLIIQNDTTSKALIYGEFDNKKITINGDFEVTGKAKLPGTDSTIAALNKRIDSLIAVLISNKTITSTNNSIIDSLKIGLVAYYPFSGNAGDSSGNGNHGVVNGAILTTGKSGVSNTAYQFNGTTNTINLPNPFFNGAQTNQFSVYCRFKINNSGNYNLWGKTFFWGEINLHVTSDNNIGIFWANSNSGNTYSAGASGLNSISVGQWNDAVINYSNSVIKIYINGNLVNSTMQYSLQGGSIISTSNVNSLINFAQDNGSNRFGVATIGGLLAQYLNGAIDDFRLYNRPLTQSEISYLTTH